MLSTHDATGAVYGDGGSIQIHGEDLTFSRNYAESDGGAIAIIANSHVNSFRASFDSNTAGGRGGAIYMALPNTTMTTVYEGCQFSSNGATTGGAIYFDAEDATLDVTGSGLDQNFASKKINILSFHDIFHVAFDPTTVE